MKAGVVLIAAILTTCPVSRSEPYVLHCTGSKLIEIEAVGDRAAQFDKYLLVDEVARSVDFLFDGIWYECSGFCLSRVSRDRLVLGDSYEDEIWSGYSELEIDLEALSFNETSVGSSHSTALSETSDTTFNVSATGTCKRIDIQDVQFRGGTGKPAPRAPQS